MVTTIESLINQLQKNTTNPDKVIQALKHVTMQHFEEQKGIDRKARMSKIREYIKITDVDNSSGNDKLSEETIDDSQNHFIIKPQNSSHTAYPQSATTTGTLTFPYSASNPSKYGAVARFANSQYITIPDDTSIDVDINQSFSFFFRWSLATNDLSPASIFCKKDESTSTNAGIHIWINAPQGNDYSSTDYQSGAGNYATADANGTINCRVADGSNEVNASYSVSPSTELFDGNWHSVVITLGDIGADYNGTDYQAADYKTTATEDVIIYIDGTAKSTTDYSSVTGTIGNARDIIVGGRDNSGTIDQKASCDLAWFFWDGHEMSSAEATSFNTGQIEIYSNPVLAAFFFENDDSLDDLNAILT